MFIVNYILFYPIAIFINVVVHEFGHAIPALLLTKQRVEVFIGSYGDEKKSFPLRTKFINIWFNPNVFLKGRGLCRQTAKNTPIKKQLIYVAGGPAASFMLTCIAIFYSPIYNADGDMNGGHFVFVSAAMATFFVSIIPRKKRIITAGNNQISNDGAQLQRLWRLRKYEKEYYKAYEAYNAKDYNTSADLCEALWNKRIKVQELFTYALSSMLMAKQYSRALSFCKEIKDTSNLNEDDYCLISLAEIHSKLYEEAVIALKLSLGLNPNHYNSLNNIGYVYTVIGEFNTAIEYLDRAIAVNPLFGYAFNNRGYAKIKTGDLAGGYDDVQKSLELDNTDAYTYRNLGVYYMHLGEFDKALQQLIKAKEMDSNTDMIDDLIAETQNSLTTATLNQ